MAENDIRNIQFQLSKTASRALSQEASELFERGAALLESGRFGEAAELLRLASEKAPGHARIRSLLGVSVAHFDRDFPQARSLCESAAKQEFFNPDLYFNLARIHLLFGFRSEAMRYLRRGEMIDPGHRSISTQLERLGRRAPPLVPFLPRKHPVNRALGEVRSLIRTSLSKRVAA